VFVLIYTVFLSVPASVFLMILGGAGAVFFGYNLFMIYVSLEEMSENRKK
jgi:hypothetical protein